MPRQPPQGFPPEVRFHRANRHFRFAPSPNQLWSARGSPEPLQVLIGSDKFLPPASRSWDRFFPQSAREVEGFPERLPIVPAPFAQRPGPALLPPEAGRQFPKEEQTGRPPLSIFVNAGPPAP